MTGNLSSTVICGVQQRVTRRTASRRLADDLMVNIFISYSRRNSETADELASQLERLGHDVWIDRVNIAGGDDWQAELERRIPQIDVMVVLWSHDAAQSKWVSRENSFADSKDKKIIPVRLDDTDPAEDILLHRMNIIDARDKDIAEVAIAIHRALVGPSRLDTINDLPVSTSATSMEDYKQQETPEAMGQSNSMPETFSHRRRVSMSALLATVLTCIGLVLAFLALYPQEWRDNLLYSVGLLGPSATPTLLLTPTETSIATPTPTAIETLTATHLPTLIVIGPPTAGVTTSPVEQGFSLTALNVWRQAQGYEALVENAVLQHVAVTHEREIRSRPLAELGDVMMNDEHYTVPEQATDAGYAGDSIAVVYAERDYNPTLEDVLRSIEDQLGALTHHDLTEVGFSSFPNANTGYTYFVLLLGTGQ